MNPTEDIKKLNRRWKGRDEITPEFGEFIKLVESEAKLWWCPECNTKRNTPKQIEEKYCTRCMVRMIEVCK